MKTQIKKLLLSFIVIGAFAFYTISQKRNQAISPTIALGGNASAGSAGSNSAGNSSTAYKDGTYIGTVADAYYGNIQVKAVINGGRLSDVVFLDYPKDRDRSLRISTEAMPLLKEEAIQAQSAQVDIISGATDSSGAFISSLSSALAQANL